MKVQALAFLSLLVLSGSAFAEGGCDPGYTPVNNGQNWTCIPGGNDTSTVQPQSNSTKRPSGYWEKTWGAIAPSPKGGVLGTAVGAKTKQAAERLALSDCKAKGGGACKVNLAYHNQCAVMIVGDKYLTSYSNATIEEAANRGLKECNADNTGCRVYYSACTEPIYRQY